MNKTEEESTEYVLTVTVPREITHDFVSHLVLTQPQTGARVIVPVRFTGRSARPGEEIGEKLNSYFSQEAKASTVKDYHQGSTIWSVLLVVLLVVISTLFCLLNVF